MKQSKPITIRQATEQDLEFLVNFKIALLEVYRTFDRDINPKKQAKSIIKRHFKEAIAEETRFVLVALIDDKLVGYAQAYINPNVSTNGWIEEVFVDEPYRNRGVAMALIEKSSTVLAKQGATQVQLALYPQNKPALELYAKLGFEKVPTKMIKMARRLGKE